MKILAARYREEMQADRYVFPNGCRHRIVASNLMRAYRQAVRESGIAKARFHDLRHTFASRLVQNGADLFAVQKLGRWKNTSMVMRYAHHYTESLRATIEMMDGGKQPIITNLSQSAKKRISSPPLKLVSG
jgi:integrase